MTFRPCCQATAIGSLPHSDPEEACRVVLENLTAIPVWPQLPRRSFKENMYVQFTEGMPAIVIDEEKEKVFFDTSGEVIDEVEGFYQKYLKDDPDAFAISVEYAAGLQGLIEAVQARDDREITYIKGQVTGPVSFGLTVTDADKRPSLYHELLLDPILKTLAMKARWQETVIKSALPGKETMIFIDEPYLTSIGSAFISLSREDVVEHIRTVANSISGLSGVHCCGNTDWTIFPEAGIDIISFDAFDYVESIALYPAEINDFLENGGILAWGIVPTIYPEAAAIDREDVDSLALRMEQSIKLLAEKGIDHDLLLQSCLITPNCGTGSMTEAKAEKVFSLVKEVSSKLRAKYFRAL